MDKMLKELQPIAAIYADILSKIMKVSITIVDKDMYRIAGSKPAMSYEIESKVNIAGRGGILLHTIEDKQAHIVENPKDDPICDGCPFKSRCPDKYHMSAPIIVENEVWGALAFLATNNLERSRMVKNKQLYQEFLFQFAELLALKMQDTMKANNHLVYMQLLNAIIDYSEVGVLVFNQNGQIAIMNSQGKSLLSYVGVLPVDARLSLMELDGEVSAYRLLFEDQTYLLSGKMYHVHLENYSDIFLFTNGIRTADTDAGCMGIFGKWRIRGESRQSLLLQQKILQFAMSKAPALVTGESGTEKRETALAIHEEGPRKENPFIVVNCCAFSDDMLEKELWGIASGTTKKGIPGKFETALKGTLLLEEIDSLSMTMQVKLLMVLNNGEFSRVGGSRKIRLNSRIITTASGNLKQMMADGVFFEELFYRLNVLSVHIPPLRERREDIHIQGGLFLKAAAKKAGKTILSITPEFWQQAEAFTWNGNIWELEGAMEYAVSLMGVDGIIRKELLPEQVQQAIPVWDAPVVTLQELEQEALRKALKHSGRDLQAREQVAKQLGISVATLYRKIKQYSL